MSSTADTPRIRILIVEDAIDQAMFLRAMLESTDLFEVAWAQDGGRALQMYADDEYDFVLTDLNLPGMDGFDLTRELKRISKVPVLAVTGYTHQSYFESAYRAGVDALLNKPVDRDELIGRLQELRPELFPAADAGVRVFALAAHPGDAIYGCGGTLARHVNDGAEAMILVLHPGDAALAAAARAAADTLGARVIVPPQGDDEDPAQRQLLLERIIRDLDPDFAYVPSLGDDQPDRREAHRIARGALSDVKTVLHYATATTTLDFRPSAFRDVSGVMTRKMTALDHFSDFVGTRPELSSRFAQASARWWGRFAKFGEVEPFEFPQKGG